MDFNNDDNYSDDTECLILLHGLMQIYIRKLLSFNLLINQMETSTRGEAFFDQQMHFSNLMNKFTGNREHLFKHHLRMDKLSFLKLFDILHKDLCVNERMAKLRGGAVLPEVQIYCAICFLAGGSHLDIYEKVGISKPQFYCIIWNVFAAICESKNPIIDNIHFPETEEQCQKLAHDFTNISYNQAICNCVGAIDGWLLTIPTPPKKDVGSVRSYFSGHYCCHGVNVQFVADAHCCFTYHGIAGPGSIGDVNAFNVSAISELVDQLSAGYVIIGDAAYNPN